MNTVASLIEEACELLSPEDHRPVRSVAANNALRCLQTARARFDQAPTQRASRLLYEEMDKWATFDKGHIRVEVLVELLKQEGLLAEPHEEEDEGSS